MNDREQLVREAEELAKWHDEMAYHDFIAGGVAAGKHHKRASLIRRLLSLLPKEGEVVVPVHPTDAIYEAGKHKMKWSTNPVEIYKAMIEARPK